MPNPEVNQPMTVEYAKSVCVAVIRVADGAQSLGYIGKRQNEKLFDLARTVLKPMAEYILQAVEDDIKEGYGLVTCLLPEYAPLRAMESALDQAVPGWREGK